MGNFGAYLQDIRRDCKGELPVAILLVALGAVLEGIGIVAILPFVAVIIGTADTQIGRDILEFLSGLGLTTDLSRALALSGAFLAVLGLRNIIVWLRDTRLQALGLGYVDRWRVRLFDAVGRADWLTVISLKRSDIEHALTNDVSRISAGTSQLLRSGAAVSLAVVQLLVIAVLSPVLLALVCVMFAVAMLFTMPLLRKANRLGRNLTHSGRKIYGVLGNFMSSQKLARLNNAEADFSERFNGTITEVRGNQIAYVSSQASAKGWFQMAAGLVVLAALLIGYFVLQTPVSVLGVTLLVLARLAGPIQQMATTGQMIANTLPAFEALTTLRRDLDEVAVVANGAAAVQEKRTPASLKLNRINFTYPGSSEAVLTNVSLHIQPGEIVALTGASGSGKTTLLDIATGLLVSASGDVRVDDVPLTDHAARRHWRDQIAYLPQDPFLFDDTIRENLLWSAKTSDESAIDAALQTSMAAQFLDKKHLGLGTRVGERGQSLSGGERQRLCIARALLRQPRLLILDEATNALDAIIEDTILRNLAAMRDQFSILLVTHRAETLHHADRVISLSQGPDR